MYDNLNLKEKVQVYIKNKKRVSLIQSVAIVIGLSVLCIITSFLAK